MQWANDEGQGTESTSKESQHLEEDQERRPNQPQPSNRLGALDKNAQMPPLLVQNMDHSSGQSDTSHGLNIAISGTHQAIRRLAPEHLSHGKQAGRPSGSRAHLEVVLGHVDADDA